MAVNQIFIENSKRDLKKRYEDTDFYYTRDFIRKMLHNVYRTGNTGLIVDELFFASIGAHSIVPSSLVMIKKDESVPPCDFSEKDAKKEAYYFYLEGDK